MGATTHDSAVTPSAGEYHLLFESSPNPILIVDAQSYHVLKANGAAARAYGYAPEELVDLRIGTLWPNAEAVLAHAGAAQSSPRTWRHRRKDGAAMEVAIAVQPLSFAGRRALALHASDVTQREFSVALIEGYSSVLETIARGGPLGAVLAELVRTTERLSRGMIGSVVLLDADGRRLRHGAAPNLPPAYWRALDGLEIGPAVGSCGTAVYLGRQVIVADIANDALWKTFRSHALPHGLRACWSSPILCRAGKILGAFAMYYREVRRPDERDQRLVRAATYLAAVAIERDLADRALQTSESRLRAIVDHAFAMVYLKDLEGRYLMANRRFEEVTGIAATAVLGKTDHELFPRPLAEALKANDSKVLEGRAPVQFEEEIAQADGTHVYLSVKFPLPDAGGSPYAVGGISADITQRKRAERALARSREQLRALSARLLRVREEERARISREIHDELGQSLTALRMSQALLIRGLRAKGGGALADQLESMQAVVDTVLAAVRRIATELRPDVLDALGLAAALEWQAAEFASRTGIACRVSVPQPWVERDAERSTALFRIFQEALTNVARHSGATRVTAELRRDGGMLELTVADDGSGFVEADERASSSLGLLGMRERAAMLGGETTIASAPGGGTTVTVRLPAG
jgi:hypothetical protein